VSETAFSIIDQDQILTRCL